MRQIKEKPILWLCVFLYPVCWCGRGTLWRHPFPAGSLQGSQAALCRTLLLAEGTSPVSKPINTHTQTHTPHFNSPIHSCIQTQAIISFTHWPVEVLGCSCWPEAVGTDWWWCCARLVLGKRGMHCFYGDPGQGRSAGLPPAPPWSHMLATRTCLQHTGESFRGYIKANSIQDLFRRNDTIRHQREWRSKALKYWTTKQPSSVIESLSECSRSAWAESTWSPSASRSALVFFFSGCRSWSPGLTATGKPRQKCVTAVMGCDHTNVMGDAQNMSWWPPHLQQWWGVGSRWGSRCVRCTLGWRVCSRRRAAAGPDTGRTEPTAGPHSGANGPGGDATQPPGRRETYKGGKWSW